MIKSMRLHNFKAFRDTGLIDVKPLTVLAGPNSGGKSSILQSLLLLKQTLEGPPEIDLNLDGRYSQYSAFNELTFGKPPLSRCEVGFTFDVETHMPSRLMPMYFPDVHLPSESKTIPLVSCVEFSFRYKRRINETSIVLNHFRVSSRVKEGEGPQISGSLRNGRYRVALRGEGIDLPREYENSRIEDAMGRHFLPHGLVLEGNEESPHVLLPFSVLYPIFSAPLLHLQREVEDYLEYLGPLRARPQRAYLHSGNPLTEIGERGEHAAQILWLEKDNPISYLPALGQETQEVTLMEAVSDAFTNLGMIQPLDVKSEKSIMYQILFGIGGPRSRKAVTIADVGFGVSQLLPILVMGLRADDSALLLLEQPEIHLHPRLQANLADFLLALAKQGRRLIVETHSDHFINRLRRRIAEDETDELRKDVSILFVRPPEEAGRGSTIEPLQVDRFGVIENWPPNFLPEGADEAEAIFRAGLKKRAG